MKKRNNQFNPKRKMISLEEYDEYALWLLPLMGRIRYGGNPEHKMNPGDFNLIPPSSPRPGKSLCDTVRIFSRREAEELLRKGAGYGLVSIRTEECPSPPYIKLPKNIWSVTDDRQPLEAQLESIEQCTYHGYPIPPEDPFYDEVLKQWSIRSERSPF